jgi:hypothetical protein
MDKLIFLDIDGVLATDTEFFQSTKNFRKKFELASELNLPYPFNKKAVNIFNTILEKTYADIVLSSDWKLHWNLENMGRIFEFNGVMKKPVAFTEDAPVSMSNISNNRANEINKYVETLPDLQKFVILDDLELGRYLSHPQNFVHCKRSNEGLKQSGLIDKVLKILNDD